MDVDFKRGEDRCLGRNEFLLMQNARLKQTQKCNNLK